VCVCVCVCVCERERGRGGERERESVCLMKFKGCFPMCVHVYEYKFLKGYIQITYKHYCLLCIRTMAHEHNGNTELCLCFLSLDNKQGQMTDMILWLPEPLEKQCPIPTD
jgi:hypothetical protein